MLNKHSSLGRVSVIIPVYNAEQFIRKAVESAIKLPDVGEIILVEDGTPDNGNVLRICESLNIEYDQVLLLRHPGGANRGAGASRNLGITRASKEFIAFLDADDWYLPNRFTETIACFDNDRTIDGIYGVTGTYFYASSAVFRGQTLRKDVGDKMVTGFREEILPEDLFFEILTGRNGHFTTDAITLRKEVIKKTGFFNEDLKLHQDTELWLRCAYYCKMIGLKTNRPVAVRGVHGNNRINDIGSKSRSKFSDVLINYYKDKVLSKREWSSIKKLYLHTKYEANYSGSTKLRKLYGLLLLHLTVNFLTINRAFIR